MVDNELHPRTSHFWLIRLGISSQSWCCSSRFVDRACSPRLYPPFLLRLDLKPENLLVANNSKWMISWMDSLALGFIRRCSEDLWLWPGNIISQSNNERRTETNHLLWHRTLFIAGGMRTSDSLLPGNNRGHFLDKQIRENENASLWCLGLGENTLSWWTCGCMVVRYHSDGDAHWRYFWSLWSASFSDGSA